MPFLALSFTIAKLTILILAIVNENCSHRIYERVSTSEQDLTRQAIASIRDKGARPAIPGIVNLSEVVAENDGVSRIVLESVQELLLKVALQTARDDYEIRRERQRRGVQLLKVAGKYAGRKADIVTHERFITLRQSGLTIERTATLAGCSISQVKRVWEIHRSQTNS